MEFDDFYKVYPRHEKPHKARQAWNRLTKKEKDMAFEDCQKRFIGRERQYIPLPATYLNAKEWEGDLPPKRVASNPEIKVSHASHRMYKP